MGTSKYISSYPEFELGVSGNFFPFELGAQYVSHDKTMNMARRDNQGNPYTGPADQYNVLKIEEGQVWDIKVDNELIVSFDFSEIHCEKPD